MSSGVAAMPAPRRFLAANRGVIVAAGVFLVLLATVDFISAGPLT